MFQAHWNFLPGDLRTRFCLWKWMQADTGLVGSVHCVVTIIPYREEVISCFIFAENNIF